MTEVKIRPERYTILVAEDSPAIRKLIRTFLEFEGYYILEADSGYAALEVAKAYRHEIHLLISDLRMTGMTGLELAGNLCSIRPDMKFIFMSGHSMETSFRISHKKPAFLYKPFALSELHQLVEQTLLQ